MIGIIDYGMGNLFSVSKALERLGQVAIVSDDIQQLSECDGLILPGVGAFPDAMRAIKEKKLDLLIKENVRKQKPLLGICLGMQLLFEASHENGYNEGLSLLPGEVIHFKGEDKDGNRLKIPHMGWNNLTVHRPESVLLKGIEEGYVYFVHSFYIQTSVTEVVHATADYEVAVPAIVGKDNLFGAQFHPEKSGETGIKMLKNFCDFVNTFNETEEANDDL